MEANLIRTKLKEHIENRNELRIERKKIDTNPLNCVPLVLSEKLLLIAYIYDFEQDGYMIIRIKDISSIKYGDSQKFSEKILRNEGVLDKIVSPPITQIDNWEIVFKQLKMAENNIIIECESVENGEFYIGKIVEVNKNNLMFLNFNGAGEWDKEPTKILYRNITSISLNKKYTLTISKYLK